MTKFSRGAHAKCGYLPCHFQHFLGCGVSRQVSQPNHGTMMLPSLGLMGPRKTMRLPTVRPVCLLEAVLHNDE